MGLGSAAAAVRSLYVAKRSPTCSDSGRGTSQAPYCHIAIAVSKLRPGRTVYIGPGTYHTTVKPSVSGTASARITITAWPGRRHPTVGAGKSNGVRLANRSYVTVSHLVVSGTERAGITVSGGRHINLNHNKVSGAGRQVQGQTAPGIRLSGTSHGLVKKNHTRHNSDHGILLSNGTTRVTVSHNVSSFNAEGFQRNASGIYVIAPGNKLIGNVTHDNEDSGISFYPGGNNNFAVNNVTYNNGDHGIDDLNVHGGRLIGNTVYHNCTSGINVEGSSSHYKVVNNIAVDNAVYRAYHGIACSRRAGNIGIWDSAPATTTVDHNLVYLSKRGTMYVFKRAFRSLKGMRRATGQEKHGVQGRPRFTDAARRHFTLRARSPAIDRANSGITGERRVDAAGHHRFDDPRASNRWAQGPRRYDDLGAFEYHRHRRR
ncbi:MAG: right-handed parallel beta-helix repeat-containing protein [Nocardioides sp.]|nr:right-handed parallel beta-helix repeat-containing protein [Nocardioides sp.]